ncbi:hypothetical protein BGZ80_008306 [Entomortierella chlamydospora]|uniref:Phosphatidylglycerol/phosphatidylinositol transfer protein n=1 Tax=Entomortierella chlamydospora TaxID=101097 RepID=A0A9P6MY20_9FUNG|nr:hypothetical protein BGZ79_003733 [Entomortierella chlamydospora]KAG0017409.1 hypothetical protein BGZ80_008306 [Entomortierella chlamydospora]
MKFFAATIALVAAAVANAQVTWTDCSSGSDLAVSSMTLSPYPLCIGENVCATITGTLSAPVTSPATLTIIGTYFGTTVYTQSVDLCTVVSCPVAQSTTTLEVCVPVLSNAPAGIPVVLTISATNGNGDTLLCQTGTVTAANC